MTNFLNIIRFGRLGQMFSFCVAKFKMRQVKIVSFDVFDTLLNRPFYEPFDVFLFLAQKYEEPDFFKYRRDAERNARNTLKKAQVNFDEIYQCMPPKFAYLKDIEAQFEYDTIYQNPAGKRLYDYALQIGKQIVFTTDMYFGKDFLLRLLAKNGYPIGDQIFISGYLQKTKYQNTLFPHVIKELRVDPAKILHIGDNKQSDYDAARIAGLRALQLHSSKSRFLKLHPQFDQLLKTHRTDLTLGVIFGFAIKHFTQCRDFGGYWEEFGYIYGGSVCFGLSKFIIDELEKMKIDELICVARDGYTIEKIIHLLAPHLRTHYIHANRAINLLVSLETDNELPWTHKAESIIRMYRQISDDFEKRCNRKRWTNNNERAAFIRENRDILLPLSQSILKGYLRYIETFNVKSRRIALFDIAGGAFNSYKLLKKVFPDKDILGLYWLISAKNNYTCVAYQKDFKHHFKKYEMIELLVTAPELPARNIRTNGELVRQDNRYERKRIAIYKRICKSEVQFTNDYLSTFGDLICFDVTSLIDLVNVVCTTPSLRDRWHFRVILHPMDEANTKYVKLINLIEFKTIKKSVRMLRYRIMSQVTWGRYRKHYKKKVHAMSNVH